MEDVHNLKLIQPYFDEVFFGIKPFELRKDDRDYKVGDYINFHEWDGKNYVGSECTKLITYILRDVPEYGLKEGYVILGIE